MSCALKELWVELAQKQREIWDTAVKELPKGTIVLWRHGEYWQIGSVIEVIGTVRSPSVRVKNAHTGNVVDVSLESVCKYA